MKYLYSMTIVLLIMGVVTMANSYEGNVFHKIYTHAKVEENGVRLISYDDLVSLRNSGEQFLLVDVLSAENYKSGHIEGAINLPVMTLDREKARATLNSDAHVVVYCGSFQCTASTMAAKQLAGFGYTVVDYKGGLKEWQEKGNLLASGK